MTAVGRLSTLGTWTLFKNSCEKSPDENCSVDKRRRGPKKDNFIFRLNISIRLRRGAAGEGGAL